MKTLSDPTTDWIVYTIQQEKLVELAVVNDVRFYDAQEKVLKMFPDLQVSQLVCLPRFVGKSNTPR